MRPPSQQLSGAFFEGPLGSVVRAMHEALVLIDEAQTIVAFNASAERLMGCNAGEALGQSLGRFIPSASRDGHVAQVQAFIAEQVPARAMAAGRSVEVLRSDGSLRPVEITLSRFEMALPGGNRLYCAALMRDVGEESALAEQVSALERRMHAVFELSPIAIWICDTDRIVFANRASACLFGVPTIAELVGRSLETLLDPDSHEPLRQEIARVLAGDAIGAHVNGRLTRADGETREVDIALAALPDHGHTTLQMVVNDVTERRREAADLARSRRALRDLSASVVEARAE